MKIKEINSTSKSQKNKLTLISKNWPSNPARKYVENLVDIYGSSLLTVKEFHKIDFFPYNLDHESTKYLLISKIQKSDCDFEVLCFQFCDWCFNQKSDLSFISSWIPEILDTLEDKLYSFDAFGVRYQHVQHIYCEPFSDEATFIYNLFPKKLKRNIAIQSEICTYFPQLVSKFKWSDSNFEDYLSQLNKEQIKKLITCNIDYTNLISAELFNKIKPQFDSMKLLESYHELQKTPDIINNFDFQS